MLKELVHFTINFTVLRIHLNPGCIKFLLKHAVKEFIILFAWLAEALYKYYAVYLVSILVV